MKTITIEKVKYKIPTCWQDVSIGHQIEVSRIRDEQDHVKILALVAGYGGIPIEVLKAIPFSKVENVFKHFKWINDDIPTVETKEFEHGGKTYRLQDDIFDMRTEDVVLLMTEHENHKDNPAAIYPMMLAVMYRASDEERLDDFDVDVKAEMFKELSMPLGHSVYSFFLQTGNLLKLSSLISTPEVGVSLLSEKNKELQNTLRALAQDGRGNWFTRLRIGLMIKYLQSLEKNLVTYFNSTASDSTTPRWKRMFKGFAWKKPRRKRS